MDAARSGLLLAQQRITATQTRIPWVESDSRLLPFSDAAFDGVYCFGLLHEFVGDSAESDVARIMTEIQRVLKPSRVAIITVSAGDPQKGLPHVQNFSESMFDAITVKFHSVEKKLYDDFGLLMEYCHVQGRCLHLESPYKDFIAYSVDISTRF